LGRRGPEYREKIASKRAVVITSAAMPSAFIPLATGAARALRLTARVLGAKTVAALFIGSSVRDRNPSVSPKILAKARELGQQLA
jgi:hypothetical protein